MTKTRKSYPNDVSDAEWAFCAPHLTLMREDAPQRKYPLRELFNGLRWLVRAGCPWRMMPNDLPPWHAVQQQTRRWVRAGCFAAMVVDLRRLLRLAAGRNEAAETTAGRAGRNVNFLTRVYPHAIITPTVLTPNCDQPSRSCIRVSW